MEPQSRRNRKLVLSSRRRHCPECQRARRGGRDRASHLLPKNHFLPNGSRLQPARHKVQDLEHIGRPLYDVSLFQTPAISSSLAVKPATKELKKPRSSPKPRVRLEQCVAEAEERTDAGRKKNKAAKQGPGWRQRCKRHQRISTRAEPSVCCTTCHTTQTPRWRTGPFGPHSLCNFCGLVYAKRESRLDEFSKNRAYVFVNNQRG